MAEQSLRKELAQMKPDFPRLTVPVISAARHPSESGVTFTTAYRKARGAKTGARTETRKGGEKRITVWMGKPMMKRLTAAKAALGFSTMKRTVLYLLDIALEKESAAPSAATDETAERTYDTDIISAETEKVK